MPENFFFKINVSYIFWNHLSVTIFKIVLTTTFDGWVAFYCHKNHRGYKYCYLIFSFCFSWTENCAVPNGQH